MIVQNSHLEEIYEKNKDIKPIILKTDSQLTLMCSNTFSTDGFLHTPTVEKFAFSFSWYRLFKLLIYSSLMVSLVLLAYTYIDWDEAYEFMWEKIAGKPEETWFEKYVQFPIQKGPVQWVTNVFDTVMEVLAMPNEFSDEIDS